MSFKKIEEYLPGEDDTAKDIYDVIMKAALSALLMKGGSKARPGDKFCFSREQLEEAASNEAEIQIGRDGSITVRFRSH
jgi:hypothetical protein